MQGVKSKASLMNVVKTVTVKHSSFSLINAPCIMVKVMYVNASHSLSGKGVRSRSVFESNYSPSKTETFP
jgi:hypothetical protein